MDAVTVDFTNVEVFFHFSNVGGLDSIWKEAEFACSQ